MPTKEKVKLTRSAVLSLMVLGGWNAATKWDNAKLARKVKDVPDMIDANDVTDEEMSETLLTIMAGIEDGADFEVADDEKATGKKAKKAEANGHDDDDDYGTAKQPKSKAKARAEEDDDEDEDAEEDDDAADDDSEVEEDSELEEDSDDEEEAPKAKKKDKPAKAPKGKPAKEAKPVKAVKAKKDKPAKKEHVGPPGVRPTRSRFYLSAQVIKKHGLKAGMTDEMVQEVNELAGKKNDRQTKFCMANAWHTLNGYLGTFPVTEDEDEADDE